MSNENVIADVGETLIWLLRENMSDLIPTESIALLSPSDEVGQDIRLSLRMYHIVENPYMRNQILSNISPTELQYPPLVLDLYYLLTSHSSNPNLTDRTLEEHKILGKAMRVFYDNAILSGSILQGGLSGSDEELRITLNQMALTDLTGIWQSIPNQQFKPSISYHVTPITIDSRRKTSTKRVKERDLKYYQIIEAKK